MTPLLLLTPWALAATWSVEADGSGEVPTLQQAIDRATDGDRIEAGAGTYTENLDYRGRDIHIIGADGAVLVPATTSQPLVAFRAGEGPGAVLEGFTLDGDGGSTLTITGASPTLRDLLLRDFSGNIGGAMVVMDGSVTIEDTVFTENSAETGAAIWAERAVVTLSNCTLTGNIATSHGGAVGLGADAWLEDQGSTWDTNEAGSYGGALYAEGYATVVLTDSVFEDNYAYYGGAVWVQSYSTFEGTGLRVEDNIGYSHGGAFYLYYLDGPFTLTDSELIGNTSTYAAGGALYSYAYNDITLDRVTVRDNVAWTHGGGIYHYYRGDLTLRDSVVADNLTTYYAGGGVYAWTYTRDEHDLRVEGTEITGNIAAGEAGGLLARSFREFTLIDSVFADNAADDRVAGGGLLAWQNTATTVHGNRFTANFAGYGGGAYVQGHGVDPALDEEAAEAIVSWDTWTNNIFQENKARSGGALCLYDNQDSRLTNNTLIGNLATDAGGSLYLAENATDLRNSVVAWTSYGAGVHVADDDAAAGLTLAFNDFYDNAEGDLDGVLEGPASTDDGNLVEQPGFVAYSADGDPTNDQLVLTRTSSLIDAGDPELSDPDGSRSDIGAWGGPALEVVDADEDGWTSDADCDDDDPAVNPGADETWYDGLDQDCGGGSDFDADRDGLDAQEHEGDDCDDTDPELGLDCTSPDKPPPPVQDTGCGGCAASPAAPPVVLWLGLLGLVSRRREDPSLLPRPAGTPGRPRPRG